ncbi:MAG: hypothetical protein QM817_24215 [Archangium sp.]
MSETTRDKVSGDALFILKSLKDNVRQGRSNKLADVKVSLENSVSLEFDSYFFFLRKFHYIAMDREAQLKLTEQGERVVGGDDGERFGGEIADFFADQITEGLPQQGDEPMQQPPPFNPPPLPATDIILEPQSAMPQPPSRGRKPQQDDSFPQVTAPEVRPGGGYGSPPPPPPAPLPLTAAVSSPSGMMGNPGGGKGQDLDLRYQKADQIRRWPAGHGVQGQAQRARPRRVREGAEGHLRLLLVLAAR